MEAETLSSDDIFAHIANMVVKERKRGYFNGNPNEILHLFHAVDICCGDPQTNAIRGKWLVRYRSEISYVSPTLYALLSSALSERVIGQTIKDGTVVSSESLETQRRKLQLAQGVDHISPKKFGNKGVTWTEEEIEELRKKDVFTASKLPRKTRGNTLAPSVPALDNIASSVVPTTTATTTKKRGRKGKDDSEYYVGMDANNIRLAKALDKKTPKPARKRTKVTKNVTTTQPNEDKTWGIYTEQEKLQDAKFSTSGVLIL